MERVLVKSAQRVQDALIQKGIAARVVELSDSARTAQAAADALGCEVAQIVKSLVFKTKDTHRPILALVSGSQRVSEKALERVVGEQITKADAQFVREVTGFAIGGIPPLGHESQIDLIFIDETLLRFDELWAAAGTPHAVFCFKSADMVRMTGGRLAAIIE